MQQIRITCHQINARKSLVLPICHNTLRVLFLCNGCVTANETLLSERTVFIEDPLKTLVLAADTNSLILEIIYPVTTADFCEAAPKSYPYVLAYKEAPTYTEDCKSATTVSRMLVPPRILPGFSMGSVQAEGPDLIAPHCHGNVDQYFFGLSENNCVALIDGCRHAFTRNELLHIPLNSIHGVLLEENQSCHYLWIDFLLSEEALLYMDQAHKMEGGSL